MTTTRFETTETGLPTWILMGGRNCRSYHLTTEAHASLYVHECTDSMPSVSFQALCGREVTHTIVETETISLDSVCKTCASRANIIQ
jgi:hypothetical protein